MEKHGKGAYTLIGEGAVMEGEITSPHPVRIDGTLKGKLETAEMLTVGSTGAVEANVIAKSAIIGGKVVGNLTVEDRIELESNASLVGDLRARDLVINEGAVFHGNCAMDNGQTEKV
jgi:cytoskeletal protein CcmA (bactofilin family)